MLPALSSAHPYLQINPIVDGKPWPFADYTGDGKVKHPSSNYSISIHGKLEGYILYATKTKAQNAFMSLNIIYEMLLNDRPVSVDNPQTGTPLQFLDKFQNWKNLKKLARHIKDNYYKRGGICFFKPSYHGEILTMCTKIENLAKIKKDNELNPPPVNPLPNELWVQVAHYFSDKDMFIFGQINRTSHALVKQKLEQRCPQFMMEAKEHNYRGTNIVNAAKYMNAIVDGMESLRPYFNSEHLILKNGKIDPHPTLKKFTVLKLKRSECVKMDQKPLEVCEKSFWPSSLRLLCGWDENPDAKDLGGRTELDNRLSNMRYIRAKEDRERAESFEHLRRCQEQRMGLHSGPWHN